MVPLMLGVAYLTYAERKIIGWMQVRSRPPVSKPATAGRPVLFTRPSSS